MDNMFKMMGFWTAIFTVLFYIGDMHTVALIFLTNTGLFVLLGFMNLSERMYMYVFAAHLTVFFAGFTYYTTFMHTPGMH